MKNITVNIDNVEYNIEYDITQSKQGDFYTVFDTPEELGLDDGFQFRIWESNNIVKVPAFEDQRADRNKHLIVAAIARAENIDLV